MKRIMTFILTCSLLLFAGCSGGESSSESVSTEAATEARGMSYDDVNSPVDAKWFDDAVFVGDSVTLKLSYYCDEHPEALGNARFFCAGSLGFESALWDIDREDAVHPY